MITIAPPDYVAIALPEGLVGIDHFLIPWGMD